MGRRGVEVPARRQRGKLAPTAGLSGNIAYIAVMLISLGAAGMRYGLDPIWGSQFRLVTFYPAVALAAWLGGLGPGLVATIMSVACALLLLHLRVDDVACLTALTCFMLASLFVTALYESLCRMRRLAELNSEAHRLVEQHLHRIITSASDAIITIDAEQKITLFSTGAEAIFGYSATEMLGRPLDPLIPERFRQAHHGHIDAFGATWVGTRRMARERLLVGLRRNGEEFPIEAQISQVEVPGQKLYTVILRDVTERKRAEAEREQLLANAERAQRDAENALKVVKQMQSITDAARIEALQSRDRLEISNRRKDEFLAMLSHELRNPLSAVRNALVAASLDESQRSRALEIARRQTEQLGRLIDDLLDATRLTQGRITLRKERVSIVQILERAVESTRSLVESRNLHLTVAVTPETLQVEADPTRLEQVFVNLLSNAAKYTEAGGCIDVIAERQNEEVFVLIRDTGIGIAPEMLPLIWDLFTQVESGLDRAQSGLGIGLTVARRLVELHGGRIQALSEGLGRGAEFLVCLPLLPAISEGREPATIRPPMIQRCASILLVEDNRDAAETLAILLELLGHHMHVVHDGEAAMEAARSNVPDVMLVDIGLPGMDGYEVARRVRQDPALRRVTLIALTGYGHKEDKRRAMAAGFDYHLVKPVDADCLQKLLTRMRDDGPEKALLLH